MSNATDKPPNEIILDTFRGIPPASQGPLWEGLWEQHVTPWDRGGPSMALHDTLAERTDLKPPSPSSTTTKRGRRKALVPGCGRGHDAILLASFGYDVVGLDLSHTAVEEAVENEKTAWANEVYVREGVERGVVKFVVGDFFGDGWRGEDEKFDLIFDYTVGFSLFPCPFSFSFLFKGIVFWSNKARRSIWNSCDNLSGGKSRRKKTPNKCQSSPARSPFHFDRSGPRGLLSSFRPRDGWLSSSSPMGSP